MIQRSRKSFSRALAMLLSLAMAVTALPFGLTRVHAAVPDSYTVTVKDEAGNLVAGAGVRLEGVNIPLDLTEKTGEDGVAAFAVSTIEAALSEIQEGSANVRIHVSSENHGTATREVSLTKGDLVRNIEVVLTQASAQIPAADYVIRGYEGAYDGQPHGAYVAAEGYTVRYSTDGSSYGENCPTITDVGEQEVYVQLSKEGYQPVLQKVVLKVTPAVRSDFGFADPSPKDVEYTQDLILKNAASSSCEPQAVTYKSSDETIAMVGQDGTVTFLQAGTVTITAEMAAGKNYAESAASYQVTAYEPNSFGFEISAPTAVVYGPNNHTFTNQVRDPQAATVTYRIVSQERDGASASDVASINSATGEVTILAAGTIEVKAETETGLAATYTLTINRAVQSGFAFQEQYPENLAYGASYQNEAFGGEGAGAITYQITSGETVVSLEPDGTIRAIGVGDASIQAIRAADSRYEAASAVYTITAVKADQTGFAFASNSYEVKYGTRTLTVSADGGQSDGAITYSIEEGAEIASIDAASGAVTFVDQMTGSVRVKAVKAGNAYYNEISAFTTIQVTRFNASSLYHLEGDQGDNGWYTGNIDIVPAEGYMIATEDSFDAEWKDRLTLESEGVTEDLKVYLKGTEGPDAGAISDAIAIGTLKIDKTAPISMSITYSKSVMDVVLEALTLGFYQAPVTVTVEAADTVSGIESFAYAYTVSEGASSVNQGGSGTISEGDADFSRDAEKASASFEIPAQFRGHVSFTAYDRAGNHSDYADADHEIIVDSLAPEVTVVLPEGEGPDSSYYNAPVRATVRIEEANFCASDVVINVGKRLNGEAEYTETPLAPEFKPDEIEDTYVMEIQFKENADYILDISYTDKSDNESAEKQYQFTVDTIAPEISVSYDNNDAQNGDQFKGDRTATIVITEHNFTAQNVNVQITTKNAQGDVSISDYAADLREDANWEHNGDTHTASISFSAEANYTFAIGCTDLAGTANTGVTYAEGTQAPEAFTIDKTNPAGSIQIGAWEQTWTDFPETAEDDRSFGLWDNKTVQVTVTNTDELSGIASVEHFRSSEILSLEEVQESDAWIQAELDANGTFTYQVEPDERFVVYVHLVDRAGNEAYLSSDGVIVDSTFPDVEKVAPVVTLAPAQPSENGIYNTDVRVDVDVQDPVSGADVFSGLKSVTYKIYNKSLREGQAVTAEGILFEFNNKAPQKEDLVQWVSTSRANEFNIKLEQILVDSAANNSNSVVVEITALDNAYNKTIRSCELMIDVTEPTITVGYDNNNADSNRYFKDKRTAMIVITERNFDPNDVKITIQNTDGTIPAVSSWTKKASSGNPDDTTWTATVVYSADGDYDFAIAYTDEANNACTQPAFADGTVAGASFTIDRTIPTVQVTYDNNSAANGNYYKDIRTATIVITEHNLDPNGADRDHVDVALTATDDGTAITRPAVSAWTTDGNRHTATITYGADAFYTFSIKIRDKAGNSSANFERQSFYIDRTSPTLEITGVADNSANSGDVVPVVSYSDTNYDAEQVTITLTGANRKRVQLDGQYADIHNGRIFTFKNFAKKKEIDDIYTLTATLTDKAGNTSTKTITFSVNRFGSTYALDESTEKMNGTYVEEPVDVVITETNVNQLSNIKITLFKDNEAIVLTEGTDYVIEVAGGNGQWYRYTYTIFAKNFEADGVYSLTVESDDAAGNVAKNDLDTKNTALSFGVDSILPVINIENLESNTTYATENLTVEMSVEDNLKLAKVIVELDGKEIRVWSGTELEEVVNNGGNFSFDIAGNSTAAHRLVVYAVDAAGNGEKISDTELPANAEMVEGFYVTTNLWVRYYTNKPLFFGSIAGTVFIAGLIVFLIVLRKKKGEEKQ